MSKFGQKVARPARTAGQGGLAYAIVETLDAFGAEFTTRQYGALVLLGTIIVGFLQVVLEDRLGVALLRKMPPAEVDAVERSGDQPEQSDNRTRLEDGEQLPPEDNGDMLEWTGKDMR